MSPARRRSGPLTGLLASLTRSRRARTGVVILALLIIAALLAPVISPGDPARITGAPAAALPPLLALAHDSHGCGMGLGQTA